jgi:hypothetical protein
MKWILIFLMLCSAKANSQNELYGDWYNIGTERLMHFRADKDSISWCEETFLFRPKREKKGSALIIQKIQHNDLVCLLHKVETDNPQTFSTTVLRYVNGADFLDLIMDCCDGTYQDTLGLSDNFKVCDTSTVMIMRMYNRTAVDNFKKLKNVNLIPINDLKKINSLFAKKRDLMVKKYGEDKLLWVAPILFQRILTELLINFGYNPLVSEAQVNKLFDFHYY